MLRIEINDEIGFWGITESDISDQLLKIAPGEDIELIINSPGGSLYHGIAIFNLIRECAKTHPIKTVIRGLAASMATYIAIAARTVKPESQLIVMNNSIFMIHNPWVTIQGDYREMKKRAEYLEKMASMFGATYAAVSKMELGAIRAAMDAETYYIGREIIESGFANEYEELNPEEKNDPQNMRDALIISARMALETVRKNISENEKEDYCEKAVALLNGTLSGRDGLGQSLLNIKEPEKEDASSGKEGIMTPQELLAKYPECYKAVLALGEESGIKKERERANAHLKLGERAGALEAAAKYIKDGSSVMSEEVQSEYLSLMMDKKNIDNRNSDDPPPVQPGDGDSDDDAKAMAAFDAGYAGKDFSGR
jgi:ATP-dependent protease ClpP protease subunit